MLNQPSNQNTDGNRFPFTVSRTIKNTFSSDWTGLGHAFYANNGVFVFFSVMNATTKNNI